MKNDEFSFFPVFFFLLSLSLSLSVTFSLACSPSLREREKKYPTEIFKSKTKGFPIPDNHLLVINSFGLNLCKVERVEEKDLRIKTTPSLTSRKYQARHLPHTSEKRSKTRMSEKIILLDLMTFGCA